MLFATTEELGRPDAFLARELTDSVVHFLSEETHGDLPDNAQLNEMVAKVVRELGQPALARQFEELSRRPVAATAPGVADRFREFLEEASPPYVLSHVAASEKLTEFSVSYVFPKNLLAAHHDGLLTMWGLDHPLELTGSVLKADEGLLEALELAAEHTGGFLAIDAPEFALAAAENQPTKTASHYVRELRACLSGRALTAIVNLNLTSPPTFGRDLAAGPLFAGIQNLTDSQRIAELAEAIAREIAAIPGRADGCRQITIGWHLSVSDFTPEKAPRLLEIAKLTADGAPVEFYLDRPRSSVALGGGLRRHSPAVLMAVGVHLPKLADLTPGIATERFLQRLGTLARLARSAGQDRKSTRLN